MLDPETPDDEAAARIAVADQVRRLTHAIVGRTHTPDDLHALAERLKSEAHQLEQQPPEPKSTARWDDPGSFAPVPDEGDEFPNSVTRPVSGRGNPWSIPLRVYRQGDAAVTTVTLGRALEGPPLRSHGGVVAAIYDDLLGFLTVLRGTIAHTGQLSIRYLAGTPIEQPLTFRAWVDRHEGRKIFVKGECLHDGNVVTTCEGIFIEPRPST